MVTQLTAFEGIWSRKISQRAMPRNKSSRRSRLVAVTTGACMDGDLSSGYVSRYRRRPGPGAVAAQRQLQARTRRCSLNGVPSADIPVADIPVEPGLSIDII